MIEERMNTEFFIIDFFFFEGMMKLVGEWRGI